MLKKIIQLSYLFFVIIAAGACTPESKKNSPVDVSSIILDPIHIERFDQELLHLNTSNALEKHKQWKTDYGVFYSDYIEKILGIGSVQNDHQISIILSEISATDDFKVLGKTINEQVFPDLQAQEMELTEAFKRILYYFPEATIPKHFVSFFSGFAVQIPLGEDYMGIGLDMFLGADSEFYPSLIATIPAYISRRFTPDNMVPRLMENYIREEIMPQKGLNFNMLDHMLYEGKVLYLMDLTLPNVADSLKIGYTDKQLAWAEHFESQVWKLFTEENLLFETDYKKLQPYFGEAPFTAGLGDRNESAPKLGNFLGWQMVHTYMHQHSELPVTALILLEDGRTIMEKSGYRGD